MRGRLLSSLQLVSTQLGQKINTKVNFRIHPKMHTRDIRFRQTSKNAFTNHGYSPFWNSHIPNQKSIQCTLPAKPKGTSSGLEALQSNMNDTYHKSVTMC